jgi:hypothetical protein
MSKRVENIDLSALFRGQTNTQSEQVDTDKTPDITEPNTNADLQQQLLGLVAGIAVGSANREIAPAQPSVIVAKEKSSRSNHDRGRGGLTLGICIGATAMAITAYAVDDWKTSVDNRISDLRTEFNTDNGASTQVGGSPPPKYNMRLGSDTSEAESGRIFRNSDDPNEICAETAEDLACVEYVGTVDIDDGADGLVEAHELTVSVAKDGVFIDSPATAQEINLTAAEDEDFRKYFHQAVCVATGYDTGAPVAYLYNNQIKHEVVTAQLLDCSNVPDLPLPGESNG